MSEQSVPGYMEQLLEELGWNKGNRIPLASPENHTLETDLITRQNEIQCLKEALILQKQKLSDLGKYKQHVHSEYHENTRLLVAHKQQMEQEVKLTSLSSSEAELLERDITSCAKQTKDINTRIDRFQTSIAKLLKKAESLKGEVCGERGALQEWRAALERGATDITAIEQFTKQDLSKAKALETKRQKLKTQHDQLHERLMQLLADLSAEERACERISVQVVEGMEQRKQMMLMWAAAVENLRQRDNDIRHTREDYAAVERACAALAEESRAQQAFCAQQAGNNEEARRGAAQLTVRLGRLRRAHEELARDNVTLDSEVKSYQRELSNMRAALERLHGDNRRTLADQRRRDQALRQTLDQITELKNQLKDSLDKTKSSEKRAKELEDMLNEEERYTSQLAGSQQKLLHCSFVEEQKLLALKNEEKIFHMEMKSSKAVMSKLESKYRDVERSLNSQKETLYIISYSVETTGARVAHMEGARAERESCAELGAREARLREVRARHAARAALLERSAARLHDDLRRLTRDVEAEVDAHARLSVRLKTAMLNKEGGQKEAAALRARLRRLRVEETLAKLRVAQAARALASLDGAAYSLDRQRVQLDAAMRERMIEIEARKDVFGVQRRALFEDCGKLRCEIKERENRIQQLMARYDIFIASLGKDESGQQMSVTFFKIKFAAERAELRERGAALDAAVARAERDVTALEATLRVLRAAHRHYARSVQPLPAETPEMAELAALTAAYYARRDELKALQARAAALRAAVGALAARAAALADTRDKLAAREQEASGDLEAERERVAKNTAILDNAHDAARGPLRRARRLFGGCDEWRTFVVAVRARDLTEAAYNVLRALRECCAAHRDAAPRLAALAAAADLARRAPRPRRLRDALHLILTYTTSRDHSTYEAGHVISSSSSSSGARSSARSGHTRRLASLQSRLAHKLQEDTIGSHATAQEARLSSVSLRVVTLGMEQSAALPAASPSARSRRSFMR